MTLKETVGKWIDIGGAADTADKEELCSSRSLEVGPSVVGDSGIKGGGSWHTGGGSEAAVDPGGGDAGGDEGKD